MINEGIINRVTRAIAQPTPKKYIFIDILNDDRGKQLIEGIEYVIGDARSGNEDKQEIAESYAEALKKEFGYDYFGIDKNW